MNYCSTFVRGELQSLNLDESHLKQVDPPNITYFWKRFSQVCQTVPIWDNFQLSWMLRGHRGFNPDSNPVLLSTFSHQGWLFKAKGENVVASPHSNNVLDFIVECSVTRQHPRRSQGCEYSVRLVRNSQVHCIHICGWALPHSPPPYVHLAFLSCDKCSQAFPVCRHSSASIYYTKHIQNNNF